MSERSFAEDVKQLGYGAGEILRGEGILAITKALLQSGVSYVGGYPGAPISHLLDVMADANESLLKPMGIYFELSGSEAAAAALLGASINYPMRGAVTWKSVVGTNVASDALSHVASAGVIGGSLIVIGEDYGEGASILQERTHSTALKSSIPLLDPAQQPAVLRPLRRGGLRAERGVQRAGVLLHPDSRLPHAGHACLQGQRSAGHQPAVAADRAVVQSGADQPAALHLRDGGARSSPSGCRPRSGTSSSTGSTSTCRARSRTSGSSCRAGCGTAWRAASTCSAWPTCGAARRCPLLVLNALHPLVPEELIAFLRGKRHVFVRRGRHAELHRARAEGAGPRGAARRRDPRQGAAVAPRRVRAGAGHRRAAQVPHPGAAERRRR